MCLPDGRRDRRIRRNRLLRFRPARPADMGVMPLHRRGDRHRESATPALDAALPAGGKQLAGQAGGYAVELATTRFLLRDFEDGDARAFEAYHDDPRSREFYGAHEAREGHARELLGLFASWAAARPRRNYQLAVVRRSEPAVLVGCCGLRCEDAAPGTAELGIELAPACWGRHAYAVEVARALLAFGFDTLALQAIHGETVSANARVVRLARFYGATPAELPAPAWMSARGWTRVEWRITRSQWENGRLAQRRTPVPEPRPATTGDARQ